MRKVTACVAMTLFATMPLTACVANPAPPIKATLTTLDPNIHANGGKVELEPVCNVPGYPDNMTVRINLGKTPKGDVHVDVRVGNKTIAAGTVSVQGGIATAPSFKRQALTGDPVTVTVETDKDVAIGEAILTEYQCSSNAGQPK